MAITLTTRAKNAALNGIVDDIDSGGAAGTLQILDAADNELATLPLTNPAFGAADSGSVSANTITTDTTIMSEKVNSTSVFR